ncbi:MAG: DUF937 domain-containing protein [Oscillospiraceae bacterium]|nr:DUF937 domain-containing protein [Oscillospiraceae bacterium]
MDFLSELLNQFLSGSAVKALSKKTGLKTRDLKKFIPLAVPFLLEMLTKNASSEEGASSLLAALAQHTDDKSVKKQISDSDIVDGAKIIGHILGADGAKDLKALSKKSRLSETAVSGILSSLAPVLLSSLSQAVSAKKKRSSKSSGFTGLLSGLLGFKKTGRRKSGRGKKSEELNGASLISSLLSLM